MVRELETPDGGGDPDARVVVEQRASAPQYPVVPDKTRNIALGLALGLLLGIGLASGRGGPGSGNDDRPATNDASRVRDALSTRVWRDAGDVARRTGMAHDEVEAILGLLHLDGEVVFSGGAWRRLSASLSS
jgi:hypothetical protein